MILRDAKTTAVRAISEQVSAMGSELFEIGLFDPTPPGDEAPMIPRTWDAETIVRSASWLRYQKLLWA